MRDPLAAVHAALDALEPLVKKLEGADRSAALDALVRARAGLEFEVKFTVKLPRPPNSRR